MFIISQTACELVYYVYTIDSIFFECNVLIFASAFEIIPQAAQDERSKYAMQIIAGR